MTAFNEDTRVKIPATIQFLKIGYDYQSLKDADIDFQTKVFVNRFKPALEKINERGFSYDEIKEILMDINNNDFAVVDELPYCIVEGTEAGSFRPVFIDEAHRSYSSTGEYLKNLMTCDVDAVYIALTGTPLLSRKERSNLKFGDYIHKYFYDKSIADGYTLRIKKENIDTIAKAEIKKNLDIEDNRLNDKDVFESDAYVNALGAFIEKDFVNFRLQNSDNTIGGMIVCRTNPQARKVHEWFRQNSKISTGLVITDQNDSAQYQINKNNQNDFRDTLVPDMLVVNFMLTTGYDVKRLKKMYLLREPHAQSLLQTISRVNRPYKSPNGKVYKYGYIVDFVDIEKEYDNTIELVYIFFKII